jgi:streptogramin lyase
MAARLHPAAHLCVILAICLASSACLDSDCSPGDVTCGQSAAFLLYASPACFLSRSQVIDPANWPLVQAELLSQVRRGTNGVPSVSFFGSAPGGGAYYGAALAPNGKIYPIPHNATQFAVIDPDTETEFKFGTAPGGGAWSGGVLAPNGKIYGIPWNNPSLLVIDPDTNATKSIPVTLPGAPPFYSFGVLAPNGKIYAIPTSATAFLEIDPQTDTVTTFGTAPGGNAWVGGVLAPNGKIYGMPAQATTYVEIDPSNNTTAVFGSNGVVNAYQGAALAATGIIYGAPFDETQNLAIDPLTRAVTQFGSVAGPAAKFVGAVTAPNGRIMLIPVNSASFAYIDSADQSFVQFGATGAGNAYESGILARNGKIYAAPFNATQFVAIDPGANGRFCENILTSGYFNKS